MGTYREWIEESKAEWIGKVVLYEEKKYTVMNVDYNGFLLINKKAKYTKTTAVSRYEVKAI